MSQKNAKKKLALDQGTLSRSARTTDLVKRALNIAGGLVFLAKTEFGSKVDLPLIRTLRAWRYGFTRFNYLLYGLDRCGDPRDFMSDIQTMRQWRVNYKYSDMLANKLVASLLMKHFGMPTPDLYGVIRQGRFYPIAEGQVRIAADFLAQYAEPGQRIALKPIAGNHGNGFISVESLETRYKLNAEDISLQDLVEVISGLDDYIATEFVQQGEYAAGLYPETTNTIRLVTCWDSTSKAPFVAKAVQRIGTSRSHPVDNFKAGCGGLSASIDVETGILGPGALASQKGEVAWHERHPETGARIQGLCVPLWEDLKERFLGFASVFAFTPLIAWDIVPTQSGFSIIEANPGTGMPVLQVHGPVLTDERINRFFKHHSVVK